MVRQYGVMQQIRGSASSPGRKAGGESTALTAADLKAMPILNSLDNEKALITHIMDRMRMSVVERDRRAMRCEQIDIQLSGFINLNQADKKRDTDNKLGKPPKPVDHNLPLAQGQIDGCTTYLMSIYAPETDIFEAISSADKQQMAQALTAEVNRQGQRGQYYRNLARFCLNALKYNFGVLTCYWEKEEGIIFKANPGGIVGKEIGTMWEGNLLQAADTYNFFYDTSVEFPVDLPSKGEFFAEVERRTPFRIRKMAQDKQLFGIQRWVNQEFATQVSQGTVTGGHATTYYRPPPSVRDNTAAVNGQQNWQSLLRAGADVKESSPGHELIRYTTWIVPKKFGLSSSIDLELWRIIVANGQYLAFAAKLEDSHGQLPVVVGCPLEDDLRNEQRTYAEQLLPLQHYASFLLNADQAATRKSIWGITVYNASAFPGVDFATTDLVGAMIPLRSSTTDVDIDKQFRHYNAAPDTSQIMQKMKSVIDLMQEILPTRQAQQVADLERATLYQAAATVQAGDRRNLKIARTISDQALVPLKFQMIYNIFAGMTAIDYVDQTTGERRPIAIAELVAANIQFDIATGLKGLDRLMQIQIMKDVLNACIQSPQVLQEIDIVKFLNYFSTLAGDRTDLTQFRRVAAPAPVGTQTPPNAQGAPVPAGGGRGVRPNPAPQLGAEGVAHA